MKIKSQTGETFEIGKGEIVVEMMTALGLYLGNCIMPIGMKEGLIKTYFESGAVKTTYFYINGKEITDGKNYNPFFHK